MDAAALIGPLPGGGCGPDLALTPAFDALARLREQDEAALAQGEWRRAPRVADWPDVRRRCADLLSTATKDLRLAGWWTEAAALLDGPAGLADGIELVAGLLERFGTDLHPRVDGGDVDARVAALRWLLLLIQRRAGGAPLLRIGRHAFGTDAIAAARRRGTEPGASPAGDDDGPPGIAGIRRAAATAGTAGLCAHDAAWRRAGAAIKRVEASCDAMLGAEGPSFAAVHEALAAAAAATRLLAREAGIDLESGGSADPAPGSVDAGKPLPQPGQGPVFGSPPERGAVSRLVDGAAVEASSGGAASGASTGPVDSPPASCGGLGATSARGASPPAASGDSSAAAARELSGDDTAADTAARGGPSEDAPPTAAARPGPGGGPPLVTGPARTRADAIGQLQAAAAYFRAAEPHNPAGYLADKAVRWASLPLHRWLREVLQDDAARTRLEEMLGCHDDGAAVQPPPTG